MFSQLKETYITDTLRIACYPSDNNDTTYYFMDIDFHAKDHDLLSGHWIAYYDAKKQSKALDATYNNVGELLGYSDSWYRNGQIKEHYKIIKHLAPNSSNIEEKTKWYSDGKLKEKTTFKENDTAIFTYYYQNGNIKGIDKESYHNKRYGLVGSQAFYENGQISTTMYYHYKKTPFISYFKNGTKQIESQMCNMEYIGKYQEWNDKGVLIVSGQYEDSPKLENELNSKYRDTRKFGNWKYFDDDGKKIKEENYNEKGELVSSK